MQKHQRILKERFSGVNTINETRMHHCYKPITINTFEFTITFFDNKIDTNIMDTPKKDISAAAKAFILQSS